MEEVPTFMVNEFWCDADENQISEFKAALTEAKKDLRRVLETGNPLRFAANIFTLYHRLNQVGNFATGKPKSPKTDLLMKQSYSSYMAGYLCISRLDYAGACENFIEGIEKAEEDGDLLMVAWSGSALGFCTFLLNDADRADKVLQTALEMFSRIEYPPGRLNVLVNLGYIALEKRETSQARHWFMEALQEAKLFNEYTQIPDCLIGLALIALLQDELLCATRLFLLRRS